MARTFSAVVSSACLVLTLVVPLVALVITPGDTAVIYRTVFKDFGTELPVLTQRLLGFPKVLLILGWLLLSIAQAAGCVLGPNRLWVSLVQVVLTIPAVLFYVAWHLVTVHLPTIKLMNDLS